VLDAGSMVPAVATPVRRRYRADGRAAVELSPLQLAARDRVAGRIASGEYPLVSAACPVCGADDARPVAEKDRYGLPMSTVICGRCDAVYTTPRLSDDALASFYTEDAYVLDRGDFPPAGFHELQKAKGHQIRAFIDGVARLEPGSTVVELGCSAGGVLAAFAEAGHRALGCDLDGEAVAFARDMGLEVECSDAIGFLQTLHERPGLVVLEQFLEHVPDPMGLLLDVRRVVPDGTLVYVGVPGLRHIAEQYDGDLLAYLELDHLIHFDLWTLERVVAPAGFERLAATEQVRALLRAGRSSDEPAAAPGVPIDEYIERLDASWRRRSPQRLARRLRKLPGHLRVAAGAVLGRD
jgi:SAM-dependent methyltransferase